MGCKAYLNCQSFSFADLKIATQNFEHYDFLYERAFGTFYKGWMGKKTFSPFRTGTGMPVSIERLSLESQQKIMEAQLELNILETLSHPNLVKCIGYCWTGRYLFLVHESMERGNLDNHLFTSSGYSLSWDLRTKIAIGAARGLDFLHTQKNVIHRDIKPSIIMLDGIFNAKISGFGLAISGPSDGDSYVATSVVGTSGYTDPEYMVTGHCYVKSDVYSFGVVLLELMTGLRVTCSALPKPQKNLFDWLKPYLSQKRTLLNIMDTKIEGQYSLEAMSLAAQLSLKCRTLARRRINREGNSNHPAGATIASTGSSCLAVFLLLTRTFSNSICGFISSLNSTFKLLRTELLTFRGNFFFSSIGVCL
ncbi:Protein kinase superfamily protein [Euphorbia peplus]|nr:Protein kinase superfamily protein [Euphorbia peplus]